MSVSSFLSFPFRRGVLPTGCALAAGLAGASAQESPPAPASIVIEPASLTLAVGETARLSATVLDEGGAEIPGVRVVFFSGNRLALTVTPGGAVSANRPGEHRATALLPDQPFDGTWDYYSSRDPGLRASVTVSVGVPEVTELFFEDPPAEAYAGTAVPFSVAGRDRAGDLRPGMTAQFTTSDGAVASADEFGMVSFLAEGTVRVAATSGALVAEHPVRVRKNPTERIVLSTTDRTEARVGDVIAFRAEAVAADGAAVPDLPIRFALESRPDLHRPESRGAGAPAQITARAVSSPSSRRLHGDRDERRPGGPADRADGPPECGARDRVPRPRPGSPTGSPATSGSGKARTDATTPSTAPGTPRGTPISTM